MFRKRRPQSRRYPPCLWDVPRRPQTRAWRGASSPGQSLRAPALRQACGSALSTTARSRASQRVLRAVPPSTLRRLRASEWHRPLTLRSEAGSCDDTPAAAAKHLEPSAFALHFHRISMTSHLGIRHRLATALSRVLAPFFRSEYTLMFRLASNSNTG